MKKKNEWKNKRTKKDKSKERGRKGRKNTNTIKRGGGSFKEKKMNAAKKSSFKQRQLFCLLFVTNKNIFQRSKTRQ